MGRPDCSTIPSSSSTIKIPVSVQTTPTFASGNRVAHASICSGLVDAEVVPPTFNGGAFCPGWIGITGIPAAISRLAISRNEAVVAVIRCPREVHLPAGLPFRLCPSRLDQTALLQPREAEGIQLVFSYS